MDERIRKYKQDIQIFRDEQIECLMMIGVLQAYFDRDIESQERKIQDLENAIVAAMIAIEEIESESNDER